MRTFIGLVVLLVGWIILGLTGTGKMFAGWNFGKDAKEMEVYIAQGAETAIGSTTYAIDATVSGRDIRVSGTAANDIEKAAILANVDTTHGRRVVVDDLKIISTASPYKFSGSKSGSSLTLSGNAPTADVMRPYVGNVDDNLTLAGGMPDEEWPAFVGLGVKGVNMLQNGAFAVSDRNIAISGLAGSLEEEAAVRDVFSALPDGYAASFDLQVAPTVPYIFNGKRSPDGETYSGYVPSAQARGSLAGLIGDATQGLKPTAGMPDDKWLSVVGVGVKALKGLNSGELNVVDRTVSLTGEVNTPDAMDNIKGLFTALPDGYGANVNLTSLDDGTPAELNFDWTAGKTALIEGKGPDGVSMDSLAAALKLPKLDGIFRQGKVAGSTEIMARFTGIGNVLQLLESAKANVTAETVTFVGVLLPGGDMEVAQSLLSQTLGEGAQITLSRSALEPKEGDERLNEDTGKNEIYKNGFWMVIPEPEPVVIPEPIVIVEPEPVVVPEPVEQASEPQKVEVDNSVITVVEESLLDICIKKTETFLSSAKVSYETASATLTAESRALMAELGTVLKTCVGVEGLSVEVGGHTDSQGSESFNQTLSQQRADSVRSELIRIGVPEAGITAKGYGEAQPIATNDTEEGRAQNRRTTFNWSSN